MATVHKVFTNETVAGAISPVIIFQQRLDENMAGAVQWNGLGHFNVHFEARMEPPTDATTGWFLVFNVRETLVDAQNMVFNTGKLYPLMRARVASIDTGASISAWIME